MARTSAPISFPPPLFVCGSFTNAGRLTTTRCEFGTYRRKHRRHTHISPPGTSHWHEADSTRARAKWLADTDTRQTTNNLAESNSLSTNSLLRSCLLFAWHLVFPSEVQASLPPDLIEFWKCASSANLFKDSQYAQWGIEIIDFHEARAESARHYSTRPRDFKESDLIIGRFLGDSDLLVVRNDSSAEDFGSIVVALPIDKREDWDVVADSFSSFLERLIEAEGDKFWEAR